MLSHSQRAQFQDTVWAYFGANQRSMPWRQPNRAGQFDPYAILVSELMLQQTQVSRVIPKYTAFLAEFSTVQHLATAPLAAVLIAWNGLGYNRRAKFLHQAAQDIADRPTGFPDTATELVKLPGVGPNTAGAILAYAFNQPVVYIETNIRTVFIHHFFPDQTAVTDKDLLPLIAETLDQSMPREWYWALMDYGAFLKQTVGNTARASQSYARQSTFQGSVRQIRGAVLRRLTTGPASRAELKQLLPDNRLDAVLASLVKERLIVHYSGSYQLG